MKIECRICTAPLEMTSNQCHGTTGGNHLKSADREPKSNNEYIGSFLHKSTRLVTSLYLITFTITSLRHVGC
jgi:hypothetical protein